TLHPTPGAVTEPNLDSLAGSALPAHDITDKLQLLRHPLVGSDDLVERVGYFAHDPGLVGWQSHGKIAGLHCLKRPQQLFQSKFQTRHRPRKGFDDRPLPIRMWLIFLS